MPPVISNLVYTVTSSTIVATWNTDISADSNLSAGGKAAIDNGYDGSVTSHSCVVTGLSASTLYSCIVTSGGTSSSPQNVTTNAPDSKVALKQVTIYGSETASPGSGDTCFTFVSNDGKQYITACDGTGPNSGGVNANISLSTLDNPTTMAGTPVNGFTNFGGINTYSGTDGPLGAAMTNKWGGTPFGLGGNLYCPLVRQAAPAPPTSFYQYNGGWLMSTDHGATWSNWQNPTGPVANGLVPSPIGTPEYGSNNFGWACPIRYAADDGTVGYNTAGNGFDGGNAYVYQLLLTSGFANLYMMRVPRKSLLTLTNMNFQYWIGPASPSVANFVDDANWSGTPSGLRDIFPSLDNLRTVWPVITFIPGINSYLLTTYSQLVGSTFSCVMATAPTPAGPWTIFATPTLSGRNGVSPLHSDVVANSSTTTFPMRLTITAAPGPSYQPRIISATFSTLPPPAMPNTFVQQNGTTANQNATTCVLAYGSNVTTGNLLACVWRTAIAGNPVSSVTDTLGNTWTIVGNGNDGTSTVGAGWAYTFTTASGANTVTIHLAGSAGCGMAIGEWNGPNSVRTIPTTKFGNNTPVTSAISNSFNPVTADLLIEFAECSAGSLVKDAAYTLRATSQVGGNTFALLADVLSATTGAQTAGTTFASSGGWMVGAGAFFSTIPPPSGGIPSQITITMLDTTTVLLSIPSAFTATQYIGSLRKAGGVWAVAAADSSAGSQWWPYRDWQKVVTS